MELRVDVASASKRAEIAGWFDAHARTIGTYAARRVGPVLARDVVADTFRIALERVDDYDDRRGNELAWLYGIATNVIRRHWRSEQRRLLAHTRLAASTAGPLVDPHAYIDDALDARHRYRTLVEAVVALDAHDRDLLILTAWERLSSREAGEVLGLPPGTVRRRLHKIRIQLAEGERDG